MGVMDVFEMDDRDELLAELGAAGVLTEWQREGVDLRLVGLEDMRIALLSHRAGEEGSRFGGGVAYTPEKAGSGLWLYDPVDPLSDEDIIYVAPSQISALGLRQGDMVYGRVRPPKPGERFWSVHPIDMVSGGPPDPGRLKNRPEFDELTAVFPHNPFRLSGTAGLVLLDQIAPVCRGQRGILVSPPEAGKTTLLQQIGNALVTQVDDLWVVLVDERPEEVTDFERAVPGARVLAATFDEDPHDQVRLMRIFMEMVKQRVVRGLDEFVIWDGITRFTDNLMFTLPAPKRILPGGILPEALRGLQSARVILGAAREIEGGGSLGILATCLVEDGDRGHEMTYQQYKGTGNHKIRLTKDAADRRIYPAVLVPECMTRRCENFMDPFGLAVQELLLRALQDSCPIRWPGKGSDYPVRLKELYDLLDRYPGDWLQVSKGLLRIMRRAFAPGFGDFVGRLSDGSRTVLEEHSVLP